MILRPEQEEEDWLPLPLAGSSSSLRGGATVLIGEGHYDLPSCE